jgi:imidazolonepropionase-like amidohydrolase
MSLIISGATLIDGVTTKPVEGHSIWIEAGRIKAIARRGDLGIPKSAQVIDANGKYVIPGLMDANVHLLLDVRMENLIRNEDRYEHLITEASQVALKNGLTTVFDTWGPRQPLMSVRDKINLGQIQGSRIFCAGNIIGLDGPFSEDFSPKTLDVASGTLVERINSLWAENVGPELTWMTPEQVGVEARDYIRKGIDFVKYASSEHRVAAGASAFLAFSPQSQMAIIEAAHGSGLTAQAHTTSVEGLRVAIEAGSDIIQHCNVTGRTPIPNTTLRRLVELETASTVFPFTRRRCAWITEKGDPLIGRFLSTMDMNLLGLIESGATLLLATDAGILAPEAATDRLMGNSWIAAGEDNLAELGQGHFHWMKAMEEKGFPPLEILKSATRNIATAYKKDKDLGTLEVGKIADMIILDRNPLLSVDNYRSIHLIIKDGAAVERSSLPVNPVLTKPTDHSERERYPSRRQAAGSQFPSCC